MRRASHDFTRSDASLNVIGLVNARGLVPIRTKANVTGCVKPTGSVPDRHASHQSRAGA